MRLVVVAGPACSGKMPLARKLMNADADLILVHRDFLRASFESRVDEGHITLLMGELVRGTFRIGRSAIVVAWNLEQFDIDLWTSIAAEFDVPMEWLDVRLPDVAAMIPQIAALERV
jgi:ribose 1,5-bisphosphokinase PhnN